MNFILSSIGEMSRTHSFYLICSTDDFRWIREVFMSSTIGYRRMGRKLDMEKTIDLRYIYWSETRKLGTLHLTTWWKPLTTARELSSYFLRKFSFTKRYIS